MKWLMRGLIALFAAVTLILAYGANEEATEEAKLRAMLERQIKIERDKNRKIDYADRLMNHPNGLLMTVDEQREYRQREFYRGKTGAAGDQPDMETKARFVDEVLMAKRRSPSTPVPAK